MGLPDYQLLFPTEEQFVEALNHSGLASLKPNQLTDERHFLIPPVDEFIKRIYELGEDPEFCAVRRWLSDGANGKAINAFGAQYLEFRKVLMTEDRKAFDELFAPFALEGHFDYSSLDYGGSETLFWIGFRAVVSPERCTRLHRLGSIYSVTTLIGLLADAFEEWSPQVRHTMEELVDLNNRSWKTLLARYQAVGALWAAAYEFASRKNRVLIAHLA